MLKELARAAERRLSQEEFDTSFGLVRSHEKFFEGYQLRLRENGQKKPRCVRVYEGTWYAPSMPFSRHLMLRLLYLLLAIASFACFLKADSLGGRWQDVWYMVFPKLLVVLSYLWNISAILYYGSRGRKMTVYEYNSSTGLLRRSTLSCFLTLLLESGIWTGSVLAKGLALSQARGVLLLLGAAFFMQTIRCLQNSVSYRASAPGQEN